MRKLLLIHFYNWYKFRTVWLVLIGVLSTPRPPGDYPRPLGILWGGPSWCWVHSRPNPMSFLMRKLLLVHFYNWYKFRTVWLVLSGVLTSPGPPGDYPPPLGAPWEGSWWCWVHSRPSQKVFLDQIMILTSYTNSIIFGQFGIKLLALIQLPHTWRLPLTPGWTLGRVLGVFGLFQTQSNVILNDKTIGNILQ